MTNNGDYTHSAILDYPSVSQVNLKVKENSINVIFAVTAQQRSIYDKLSKHIEGSTSATLNEDSSNVVNLVKEQYNVSDISLTIFLHFKIQWLTQMLSFKFFRKFHLLLK